MSEADPIVEHAKRILKDRGYVVIPRERHVVLTVHRSLSWLEHEHLSKDAEGWKRFQEHMDGYAARQMGIELSKAGFIVKNDRGWQQSYTRHLTEYQMAAIKPRD
ncbi:hypothetical protein [Bradyrhizobium sp. USDA 4350]